MDLLPIISRRNVENSIINKNVSYSEEIKRNIAFKFVLNMFNFDEHNVEVLKAVVDVHEYLNDNCFNR